MTMNHTNMKGFDYILRETDKDSSSIPFPDHDVIKLHDSFQIKFAVPGYKRTDFQIKTYNGALYVYTVKDFDNKVERDFGNGVETIAYVKRYIPIRSFYRTFEMPERGFVSECMLEDGILTIDIHQEDVKEKLAVYFNVGDTHTQSTLSSTPIKESSRNEVVLDQTSFEKSNN